MAMALKELIEGRIERLFSLVQLLKQVRRLAFYQESYKKKILPYLTPLYDSMNDIIGKEQAEQLITRGIIEIAPLAYMRGRTLANAFVVLDEAQEYHA